MSHVAFERIEYVGTAPAARTSGSTSSSATTITGDDLTGWPTGGVNGRFWVVLGRGTSAEEKVLCASRSSNTLTLDDVSDRGEDGTTAATHASGTTMEHVATASDLAEANQVVRQTLGAVTAKGDLLAGTAAGAVDNLGVGTNGQVLKAASGQTTGLQWGDTVVPDSAAGSGLGVSTGVLSVNVGTGLEVSSDAVRIAAAAAGAGLSGGAGTALAVNVDDSTLEINSDTLRQKDGGTTLAKMAAAAMPRWIVGPFVVSSLAGSGTQTMSVGSSVEETVTMEAGSIIGISVAMNDARSAGTATFEVYKNGSGTGLTVTINGTNTQFHYATQARGSDTFVAGDRLTIVATSSSLGGANNASAQILCSL